MYILWLRPQFDCIEECVLHVSIYTTVFRHDCAKILKPFEHALKNTIKYTRSPQIARYREFYCYTDVRESRSIPFNFVLPCIIV